MFQLVRANAKDAQRLADFAERSFRETFEPHNTPEDMTSYCTAAFGLTKQMAELSDSARETWLALEDDKVVGYYQLIFNQGEASVKDPKPVELNRIYVDTSWHGKRLSHALMQHALQQSQAQGFKTMWLGVWEKNQRAIEFYKKWNFVEVGDYDFVVGSDIQRDVIFERAIT